MYIKCLINDTFLFQGYLTKCHKEHRDSLREPLEPIIGRFVPKCDADGGYKAIQCHSGRPNCWCVNKYGKEVPNTMTTGKPNCDHSGE